MRKSIFLSLLLTILLISPVIVNSHFNIGQRKAFIMSSDLSATTIITGHVKIINEHIVMDETITIESGGILEIINSTLDFSQLTASSTLIDNGGTLIINNSHIISNLNNEYTYVISSNGDLIVVNSSFINKQLPVNFDNRQCTMIFAIEHGTNLIRLNGNRFENFTEAIMVSSASGSVNIYNNTFINCPFALTLDYLQNAIITRNTLINSIACGITAAGYNVTIKDNYIYNERNLLQTEVDLFGDITKGIDISGFRFLIANNTIINTYKSLVLCALYNSIIENNTITTTGPTEGEIQVEESEYLILRNNYISNQWDSIEIYNCRHLLIEKNYIEDGVTAIRLERVDEYDGINPLNITIQYNVITNSGFIEAQHGENIRIMYNILNHTCIMIRNDSQNILIHNNTIYYGNIVLEDSRDIIVSNNYILSTDEEAIIQDNCQNVTLEDNIIKRKTTVTTVEESQSKMPLDFILGFLVILASLIVLIVIKKRK